MSRLPDFSVKPVIDGAKVLLRPFKPEDIGSMLEVLADFEVRKLTGSVCSDEEALAPATPEELDESRKWYSTRNEQRDRLDLAIVEKATNKVVGEVVFNEYDDNANKVNFRILIGPDGRNKGLGSEATALFIKYGFETLSLNKIELQVFAFNPRGEQVYVKNGFVSEGILREDFKYNDIYVDCKLYSILSSEYFL